MRDGAYAVLSSLEAGCSQQGQSYEQQTLERSEAVGAASTAELSFQVNETKTQTRQNMESPRARLLGEPRTCTAGSSRCKSLVERSGDTAQSTYDKQLTAESGSLRSRVGVQNVQTAQFRSTMVQIRREMRIFQRARE